MINQLKERINRAHFEPFAIRLSDGRKFDVPHLNFVAVSPRTVVVIVKDISHTLNPLHIVCLDALAPAASGVARRSRGMNTKPRYIRTLAPN